MRFCGGGEGRGSGRRLCPADHGIAGSYGSVGDMLQAEELDAVYICTPHPSHAEVAVACIDAGVAVLVEKPIAPNLAGATRIVDAAQAAGVFAMEAMWTRFLPIYEVVRGWIDDGRIGDSPPGDGLVRLCRSGDARAPAIQSRPGWGKPARRRRLPAALGPVAVRRASRGLWGGGPCGRDQRG